MIIPDIDFYRLYSVFALGYDRMSEEELQMSEISASSPPKDVPCHKTQNEKQSHNNSPRSHNDIDAPKETYRKIEDCNEEAIQDESKENLNMTEISGNRNVPK